MTPNTARPGALTAAYLRLCGAVIRAAAPQIGEPYAQELAATLGERIRDARHRPPRRRLAIYRRELAALLTVALRGPRHRITQSLPKRRSPALLEIAQVFLNDLRRAARQLYRAPGFTLVAVGVLAIGIGANSAVFGIVNSILLRPLPYPQPDQLLRIQLENSANRFNVSVADYLALRDAPGFEHVGAYTVSGISWYPQTFTMTLTDGAEPRVIEGTWVTVGFFGALGVDPLLGRALAPGEDSPAAEPVAMISHAFWQSHFSADPNVVGETVEINRTAYGVIGVMPADFHPLGNPAAQIWPVLRLLEPGRRGPFFLTTVARLEPGWSQAQATAALQVARQSVDEQWRESFAPDSTIYATSLWNEEVVGDTRNMLWGLLVAVGLVLVIALTNVTNLLLSRASMRDAEFALRAAIGGSRRQLLGQLLVEGALLAGLGAVAGLALARGLLEVLLAVAPERLPRQAEISLDGSVLLFTLGLSALAALMFGLVPARQSVRTSVVGALREGGGTSTASRQRMRVRAVLVVAELALAVPLLVGALLMVDYLIGLQSTDPGFDAESAVTLRINLPVERFDSFDEIVTFYRELGEATAALPSVRHAGISSSLPPGNLSVRNNFNLEGRERQEGETDPVSHYVSVSASYFGTLGIPLLKGRLLGPDDIDGNEMVAVVDENFVDRYLQGEEPLGQQMQFGGCTQCPWARVVGVVANVRYAGLTRPAEPTIYVPIQQEPVRVAYVSLRASGTTAAAARDARTTLAQLLPGVAPTRVATLDALLRDSVAMPRYRTLLLTSFAAIAVVLAALGVYGMMSAFVGQHSREVGVRMAVGAGGPEIRRLVLGRAFRLVVPGLLAGLALTLLSGATLRAIVAELGTARPALIAAACIFLGLVAAAGTLVPAIRASRVDPVAALRDG